MRPQDFFIGAKIVLKDYHFELTGSDEFTLRFMEAHAFDYPMANINLILSKIRDAVQPFYKEFFTKYLGKDVTTFANNALVCTRTTRAALIDLLGENISEHEIITFIRHFHTKSSVGGNKSIGESMTRSLVQMELARNLWDDLQNVKVFIYHLFKKDEHDYLTDNELYKVITACRLPISNDLITPMLNA